MSKTSITKFVILFTLIFTFGLNADAQNASVGQTKTDAKSENSPAGDETQERIKQMEAQINAMQAQIEALKNQINPKPAAENKTAPAQVKAEVKPTEAAKTETKTQPPKQLGIDLGAVRVTPYATIYFNAFSNRGGTNNADVPLFATPTGQGATSASVRQTRLGLKFDAGKIGNAKLTGILEADFFGGLPAVGIGENFGVVRVRLANARLDWERTSVTIGQDWMPFAPVNPNSLAAAAIPQMAAAGNNWARIPQIRVDYKLGDKFTLTGAILAPQTGDSNATAVFFLQPNSGAASRTPFFQTRIAYADKNWWGTKKPGSIGFSTHYGRSRVLTGVTNVRNDIDSVGFAADWSFPLQKRLSLAGEAFFGRDLAGFQGGIFQNYVTDFAYRSGAVVTPGGVRGIGTRGGWMQVGFTPDVLKDRLTFFASAGIDDPRDEDLFSVSRTNYRKQNRSYAFNVLYKITPQFSLGTEYRHLETYYLFTGRKTAEHLNFSGAFSF